MRPVSKDHGEICYPFIYEDSPVCDFEIASDELCSRIGLVLTYDLDDVSRDILLRLQPNVYHLNGSVRALVAIEHSGRKSPDPILFRYANLLANIMYALASYTNCVHQVNEVEFVSHSY